MRHQPRVDGRTVHFCSEYWRHEWEQGRTRYPPPVDSGNCGMRVCAICRTASPFYFNVNGCVCWDCAQRGELISNQIRQMVEGADTILVNRLRQIGFSDREIVVASLIYHDGMTQRQAGDWCGLSQVRVLQIIRSVEVKLTGAGLSIPKRNNTPGPRVRHYDPRQLERIVDPHHGPLDELIEREEQAASPTAV